MAAKDGGRVLEGQWGGGAECSRAWAGEGRGLRIFSRSWDSVEAAMGWVVVRMRNN